MLGSSAPTSDPDDPRHRRSAGAESSATSRFNEEHFSVGRDGRLSLNVADRTTRREWLPAAATDGGVSNKSDVQNLLGWDLAKLNNEVKVVWYFQEVARDVGEQDMATWLARLDYGNQDISSGIDRFWLGASLEINAYQQMEMVKALKHGTLPFAPAHQHLVD